MPIAITFHKDCKSTAKTVAGKKYDVHLTEGLKAMAAESAAASTLLGGTNLTANYQIVIADGKDVPTATFGTRVTVNLDETKASKATDVNGLKELIESTLFELTNAKNDAAFKALEKSLKEGKLPILGATGYGVSKAKYEAEASWTVCEILKQRKESGYTPSVWGTKQLLAAAGKSSLAAFQEYFRTQPHSAGAPNNTPMKLPSQEFYAYNGAVTVAGFNNNKVMDMAFKVKKAGADISIKEIGSTALGASGEGSMASVGQTNPDFAARYYHVFFGLLTSTPGVVVTYTAGKAKDWEFTSAMKACTVDKNDAVKNKLAQALANA